MSNQIPMMKRGICLACGSTEVHAGTEMVFKRGINSSNTIPINFLNVATLTNFVCTTCGYVESYILDAGALEKIAKSWPKVNSSAL